MAWRIDAVAEAEGAGERWVCTLRDDAGAEVLRWILHEPMLRLVASLRQARVAAGGAGVAAWTLSLPAGRRISRRLTQLGGLVAALFRDPASVADED